MHCVCDCDLVSEVDDDDGLDLLRDEAVLKLVSKMVTILRVWQSRNAVSSSLKDQVRSLEKHIISPSCR